MTLLLLVVAIISILAILCHKSNHIGIQHEEKEMEQRKEKKRKEKKKKTMKDFVGGFDVCRDENVDVNGHNIGYSILLHYQ